MLQSPKLSRPVPFGISLMMVAAVTACGGGNGASTPTDTAATAASLVGAASVSAVSAETVIDTPSANMAAMEASAQALKVRVNKAADSAPAANPGVNPAGTSTLAATPAPVADPVVALDTRVAAALLAAAAAPLSAQASVSSPAPELAPIKVTVAAPVIASLPTTGRVSKTMTATWPQVDFSRLQTSTAGISYANLSPTSQVPELSGDGTGAFRTVCLFSHMAFDDPIVYPGRPGQSHLHAFFGNTGVNAYSTANSIANTGNSTCRGGTINRTGYWAPAMIDTGNGVPVKPDSLVVYYKTGYNGLAPSTIQAPPQGLRMIAGDPNASALVPWGPVQFVCSGPAGDSHTPSIPTDCAVGSVIWIKISFPQCWDGVNLDSPDHRSHMAYPRGGACPSTHPTAIPEITTNVLYTVTDATAAKRWRLSSDTYDKSIPAGYSSHADWFNGWKPEVMKSWITNCDQSAKDCQAHLLGNGYATNEAL